MRFDKPVVFDLPNNKIYIIHEGEEKELLPYYDEKGVCLGYKITLEVK